MKWILYHGTGIDYVQDILKYGLRPPNLRPLFLATDIQIAKNFSKTKQQYFVGADKSNIPRKGAVFQITITDKDFDDQIKMGSDPRVVKIRRDNLEKAVKEKWHEYEWYYPISPNNIKLLK
jgi:hypothetical protein